MERAERLQQLVLGEQFDVCRRALMGELPADVHPMVVKQNPKHHAVRATSKDLPVVQIGVANSAYGLAG